MGKKRHAKGSNSAQDRKRRKEAEEKWRSAPRSDEQQQDERNRNVWNTAAFENKRFEAFYNAQNFLTDEEDFQSFMKSLVQTLPACFRLYTDNPFINEMRQELMQFIEKYHQLQQQKPVEATEENPATDKVEDEGENKLPLEQIAWYPNGSGYKLSLDRRSIRKRPELNDLHKWMVLHTENGNITRQEAVSMVPPIALDVKPHHKCLDLCAAPGSKTSQLLEIVNRSVHAEDKEQGLVVANDADTDRAYMLVHQCRRINSPLLVVTTHQGQSFPTIASDPVAFEEKNRKVNQEFFDRVLCDVPCSGDGTLRKNPAIWPKWNTSMGAVMHPLQLSIARRGVQLTKKGGLMVYSTCSLSPYENESVVAELLRTHRGKLELIDAREFLPLFKARKGLSHWNVLDDHFAAKRESQARREANQQLKQQQQQNNQTTQQQVKQEGGEGSEPMAVDTTTTTTTTSEVVDENKAAATAPAEDFSHIEDPRLRKCLEMGMLHFPTFEDVPNGVKWKYRQSLFPPTAEEAEWMHLERCLRCVPHDEDTGGFFVATLRRIDDSATSSSTASKEEEVAVTSEPAAEVAVSEEEAKATAEALALANNLEEGEGGGGGKGGNSRDNRKQREKRDSTMVKYHLWDEASYQQMKEYYQFDDAITAQSFYVREDTALNRGKSAPPATSAKTIYYFPHNVQALLQGDVNHQLKVVTSGVKAFEKKTSAAATAANNGNVEVSKDYRLLQECLPFLDRHIHARKIDVSIQDFSNLLEGGLVSYSTLSAQTLQQLSAISGGIVICTYHYKPSDVIEGEAKAADHSFSMVCWKGSSACINVMCSKIDLQSFKHQLNALRVLRSKILAAKKFPTGSSAAEGKEDNEEGEATKDDGEDEDEANEGNDENDVEEEEDDEDEQANNAEPMEDS